jgi:hypothetical protein
MNVPERIMKAVEKVGAEHPDEPDEVLIATVLDGIRSLPEFEAFQREVVRSAVQGVILEHFNSTPLKFERDLG